MGLHVDCAEGRRLLDAYLTALTLQDAAMAAKRTQEVTSGESREAQDALNAARRRYWSHVERHSCRLKGSYSQDVASSE